jgi:hypothetical protein
LDSNCRATITGPKRHRRRKVTSGGPGIRFIVAARSVSGFSIQTTLQSANGAVVVVAERLSALAQEIGEAYSFRRLAASTTLTMVSSRATSERLSLCSSRKSNVAAIGSGSEIPMDSINR